MVLLYIMDSEIGFEMSLIVVETIRGRCARFKVITATVSEIFGGHTNSSIVVLFNTRVVNELARSIRHLPSLLNMMGSAAPTIA